MSNELLIQGSRELVFDGDGSNYGVGGTPCTLCGARQTIEPFILAFVRVRMKVPGGAQSIALLCPSCIGRAVLQVERLGLWKYMTAPVKAAIQRMMNKKRRLAHPIGRPSGEGGR